MKHLSLTCVAIGFVLFASGLASQETLSAADVSQSITIVADPGPLGRIEQAAVAEQQVNWWDDKAADDNACTESFAATELRKFIAICTGRPENEIFLVMPDQVPAGGHVILIASGNAGWLAKTAPAAAEDAFAPKSDESFHIRTFADPKRIITVIKGRDRVGALYGTYAYLESLGMRFYGLGEKGTVRPPTPVDLPQELDISESPHYLTRGFWAWENRGNPDFFAWMARNRLNFWTVAPEQNHHLLKKLGMHLTGGHHNIQFFTIGPKTEYPYAHAKFGGANKPADPYPVSPEYAGDVNKDGKLSYFEAHPEWYCLKDGKRSDRLDAEFGDNYCTSNADATKELITRLLQVCIDGQWKEADILNFWMLDGGKWCACDACKASGTYTDRLMTLIDKTLKAFAEARKDGRLKRNIRIVTLAYHETLPPPSKPLPDDFDYDNCSVTYFPIERCFVHPLADPACTEVNENLLNQYNGWTQGAGRHYTGSFFIGEYYNVSSLKIIPALFTRIMATDIPWYYKTGARHFHYMHTPTLRWGTWTLNQHLMARLLWNIHTDVEELLAEYFILYYPTTSAVTRTFYRDLETATANCKPLKHYVYTKAGQYSMRSNLTDPKRNMFPLDHLHYEAYRPLLNDGPDLVEIMDAMARARQEIDDSLLQCGDDIERARLVEDEQRFAYGEAVFRLYYALVRTTIQHRLEQPDLARREFAEAMRQAEILKPMVDVVQDAGAHASAKDGLEAAVITPAYEFYKKLYGSPTSQPAKQ